MVNNNNGTKEQLLALFENNKGTYLSGEDIAEKLQISRTAVWKAVQNLRDEGYNIEAVRNKGYCLSPETDILSEQGVRKYLAMGHGADASAGSEASAGADASDSTPKLEVMQTVDSTNTLARIRASEGAEDGYTVIAGSQSMGRGRMGRAFHSPLGSGIYMSMVLRPEHFEASQALKLTTMAAVAVCEAIEAVSGEKASIKWVNDVFVRDRKVCGILTEASFGLEDGMLEYAVVGIGINAFEPEGGFPEEIKDVAGAVFQAPVSDGKNRLAAEVINRFMSYYVQVSGEAAVQTAAADYAEEYRKRCFVIGRDVKVVTPKGSRDALVLDIDRECRLIVRYENGSEETLFSGEISLRF